MAIDEGDGLVCLSVGKPDFRDRLYRATGRTLHVPTMAERVARAGDTAIAFSNVSPGAAYFLDPDGHGWVYNAAGSFGPGRRELPASEGFAVGKGEAGDTAVTERFCAEVLHDRTPALALLWLSEPDHTGHHTPLGSPEHRRAITAADANVRRVAETVARLDPDGEEILLVVGSDHGMETAAETIDLDAMLVDAGLKRGTGIVRCRRRSERHRGTRLFRRARERCRWRKSRIFSRRRTGSGGCSPAQALAETGLPTGSPARIAITMKADDRPNRHGVPGHSRIVRDSAEAKDITGFGQHGGLGVHEQGPFLFVRGGGFAPGSRTGRSSLIDIAPTVLRHLGLAADGLDGRPLPLIS